MITINDIAKIAGVAKSTVSRYLNGGSVSKKTWEKLDKIVKETGFRPNIFAKSLKAKKTGLIGVIIPRIGSPATTAIIASLDIVAKEYNQRLLIFNSDQDVEQELEGIDTFSRQKVDGIIFIATKLDERHYQLIENINIPVIVLGQHLSKIPSISYDDYNAGELIAAHAIEQQVKKVLYIGVSQQDEAVGIHRKNGVKDYLAKYNIPMEEAETTFHWQDAYKLGLKLLKESDADFVIASTDNIALGLLKAAQELGINIPKDKKLSGFGGYTIAASVYPSITTVHYPYGQAGALALCHLESGKLHPIVLPVQLIKRQSTAID